MSRILCNASANKEREGRTCGNMDGGCEKGYGKTWNNIRRDPKYEYLAN